MGTKLCGLRVQPLFFGWFQPLAPPPPQILGDVAFKVFTSYPLKLQALELFIF